jgi:hypothetical protein
MNSQYIEDEIEVTVESHDQDETLRSRLTTQLNFLRRFTNYNIEFLDDHNLILKTRYIRQTRVDHRYFRMFTIDYKPYLVTRSGCKELKYNEANNTLECVSTDQQFTTRPGIHYESLPRSYGCDPLEYEKCEHIDYYSDNEDKIVHHEWKDNKIFTPDYWLIRHDGFERRHSYSYLSFYNLGVIFVVENQLFVTGNHNTIYRLC